MNTKVDEDEITKLTQNLVNIIENKDDGVSYKLRKAFYFKGRKSDSIAKNVIELLSNEDDVILDPFFGGGSFILSALEANRYIRGIELDSYTYDILTILLTNIDRDKLNETFNTISNDIKKDVMSLYRTKCCGKDNYIQKVSFDPESDKYFNPLPSRDFKEGRNVNMIEKCSICNNKLKKFNGFDQQVLQESKQFDNSEFPTVNYIENSRINITKSTGANKYDRNFTDRNKQAFLRIQHRISDLPKSKEKEFIQHALVTSLALGKISLYGSSTDNLYHVIKNQGQDMNVWYLFESNFKSMLKFQEEYKDILVDDVNNNEHINLQNNSYRKILDSEIDKIDLIYTDFPYTDQVPYLERNQLFRVWLETFSDSEKFKLTDDILKEEIVISNAPSRPEKKTIESYYKDIDIMLNIFNKVLKEGKYMVFTMNLGRKKYIQTYSEIINLARKNGFEYVTRANIKKDDPTLIKQSAYTNTFMDEVIVIFKKLSNKSRYWYKENINYEFTATKLIYHHIRLKDEVKVTLSEAVNLIEKDLMSKGFIVTDTERNLAQKTTSNNFIVENGFVYIDSNKLYLEVEDDTTLFIKLYDLIPLYIKKLLDEQGKFLLEDLYLELTNYLFLSNPNNLAQLIEDENYQNQISMLIANYCDVKNGYYIEKEINNAELKNKEDISQFDGTEFEHLIKDLLKKEGYFNNIINGGAGDRGVDIIASILIKDKIERHIFQCKRWISNVGSEPIQRLYAEKSYNKYDKAFCVTTSDYTSEGKDALNRFNVEGWNGWDVQEKLNKHFPDKYYNTTLNIKK